MYYFSIAIPTCNAGPRFNKLLQSIKKQDLRPQNVLVIDSGSTDRTVELSMQYGCNVIRINNRDFNHGATRRLAVDRLPGDIVVYMTQDVVLADRKSLSELIKCFSDQQVGAAYGRQIPWQHATAIEAYARLFNYPAVSRVKSIADTAGLGIKTAFISNSFAAYRREAYVEAGGFPSNVILGEDTYLAAKMLITGWKIAYCATAGVYHSHNYNVVQQFRRYFDTGVFHSRNPWIRHTFGQAEGEGLRFIKSELQYLWQTDKQALAASLLFSAAKFTGYQLGMAEKFLPRVVKKSLSMSRNYWSY